MLARGASFIADDLALLRMEAGRVRLGPFRDVANLNTDTVEIFPELGHLRDAPKRGNGKYSISIPERFPETRILEAGPGIVLRLRSGQNATLERVPPAASLDGMFSMAWFGSRPESNEAHFRTLTDWLFECEQWYVSRAYMRERLDELMSLLSRVEDVGGIQ
jgi:hypothetical protein